MIRPARAGGCTRRRSRWAGRRFAFSSKIFGPGPIPLDGHTALPYPINMATERPKQYVLLPGPRDGGPSIRSYERTVRDIHEWDTRTVGRVRHGGAEFVVQQHRVRQDEWEALPSLNWLDVQ